MNNSSSGFILHVSDFHLTDSEKEINYARAALKALSNKLKLEGIRIDYLVHTGDIINSGDLYEKVACTLKLYENYAIEEIIKKGKKEKVIRKFDFVKFEKEAPISIKNRFNSFLEQYTIKRFQSAVNIMQEFVSDLNIPLGSVIICCGNHDVMRPVNTSEYHVSCQKKKIGRYHYNCDEEHKIFKPFEDFLDNLGVANSRKKCGESGVTQCVVDNLNVVILNTNWRNPPDMKPGYYCIRCDKVQEAIKKCDKSCNRLNIVLAHKPIYEICEKARLSYKRYIKTPFMAALQDFIGNSGIYFCGDKHTRSIVGSYFHDIPHYIGGEPLTIKSSNQSGYEVEYNLLEVTSNQFGMDRKIHLRSKNGTKWICELRPQDAITAQLYDLSKGYIIRNVFETITPFKSFRTWENLCQEIYGFDVARRKYWHASLNNLYKSICKFRECGITDVSWNAEENVFVFIRDRLKVRMKDPNSKNLMNLRGEYSSGKSTFLGLLYIYLLYQHSMGQIDFIPAYFNLENNEMLKRVESSSSYYDAAKYAFQNFAEKIQKISSKEHQSICYILDGLDEQDCWSYCSEDSVGRGLLDVLSQYNYAWYIMSFSQHRLPCFKNTMPIRKYNDKSDILYFNPIDVQESESKDKRFTSFVKAFIEIKKFPVQSHQSKLFEITEDQLNAECNIIRNFRRLTINPGFMYHNYDFLTATDKDDKLLYYHEPAKDIYNDYIDRQHEICLHDLGYGFITYAPAMAFLFSYHGYTYERFKRLHEDNVIKDKHILEPILQNQNKVYGTFLFIKKQKDVREYLIALHYNRELRYYAEHPRIPIEEDSILNEFITRNIAVLIRKLWTDTNKFIIVCEKLLYREELSNCMQSMLIYCLAHIKIYKPLRDRLLEKLRKKAETTLLKQNPNIKTVEQITWEIIGKDSAEKLKNFIDLSLLHTMKIFDFEDRKNSLNLVKTMELDESFRSYNMRYQMVYYGDLFIRGEDRLRPLDPSFDRIGKGFDFHNCFNYLYVKLCSDKPYELREFDMYTLWNLIKTRLDTEYLREHYGTVNPEDTFFFRKSFEKKAIKILEQAKDIFHSYLFNHEQEIPQFIKLADEKLTDELNLRQTE